MWNPVYFNYGIAVHGAGNVPSYPASHGCVRIPMHIGNYFPSLVKYGDQVFVFDGIKEPEAYGAQVAAVQHARPELHDHDVVHHDDHDGRPHHPAGSDPGADHPGAPAADRAPDHAGAASTPAPGNGQGGEPAPSTP